MITYLCLYIYTAYSICLLCLLHSILCNVSLDTPACSCILDDKYHENTQFCSVSTLELCAKCSGLEHFECSKTERKDREEIQKGAMKYYCSSCFMNNPSVIAFDTSKLIEIPLSTTTGAIIHVTSTTKAIPVSIPKVVYTCKSCTFETETIEKLQCHEQEPHRFPCEDCDMVFGNQAEKKEHGQKKHDLHKLPSVNAKSPSPVRENWKNAV